LNLEEELIKTQKIFAGLIVMTGLAFAQTPTVSGVTHGAWNSSKIAPGGYFVVYGTNMGPASIAINGLPYQKTAGGTGVKFTPVAGGTTLDAFMYYSVAGQISGILPSSATPGTYNMVVTYNGQSSAPFSVTVNERAFGLFTTAQSGTGPVSAQNYNSATDVTINGYVSGTGYAPAVTGKTLALILWGTGLGASDGPDDRAPGVQDLRGKGANVSVIISGRELPADIYAGRSPEFPGVDQVNLSLPADIAQGCTVTLQVKVNGVLSNQTTIAIAPSGATACSHPFLTPEQLTKLLSGSTLTTGFFSLAKQVTSIVPGFSISTETISGSFARIGMSNIDTFGGAGAAVLGGTVGSCSVYKQTLQGTNLIPSPVSPLDAGNQLTLNGPGVVSKVIPLKSGTYSAALSTAGQGVITTGTYTLAGTGGADVGAFSAPLTLTNPIAWQNQSSVTSIAKSQALNLSWTGGNAGDIVSITIIGGTATGSGTSAVTDATIVTCIADAAAHAFSVPSSALSQLPDVAAFSTTQIGLLTLQSVINAKFNAPLTAGGNVDYAVFSASNGGSNPVTITP
jgi:uncharacterized protein (TIGR03437 family)